MNFEKGEMPKNILQKRTIGIVFSDEERQGKKVLWKEIVSLSHPTFVQLGIDIVSWYNWSDIVVSNYRRKLLSEIMLKRNIVYILFFFYKNKELTLHVTKFNRQWTLTNYGQPSWYVTDEKMDIILSTLKKAVVARQLVKSNMLINDFPEYHTLLNARENKVKRDIIRLNYETHIKNSLLAIDMPMPSGHMELSDMVLDSLGVVEGFKRYPFKHKVVSASDTEKKLLDDKILYRLFWVYGKPEKIVETYHIDTTLWGRQMLKSKLPLDGNYYFKAMVKNMYSGVIFCGDYWDGGKTVREAIDRFISYKRYK